MRKVMKREEEERAMDSCPRSYRSRRFLMLLPILSFVLLPAVVQGVEYVQGTSNSKGGCGLEVDADICVMIDRTGSTNGSELNLEKDAVISLLEYFDGLVLGKPRVAIGTFNGPCVSGQSGCPSSSDHARIIAGLTNDYGDSPSPGPATLVFSTIDDLTAGPTTGQTDLEMAINVCQTELTNNGDAQTPNYILVITDGIPNVPQCSPIDYCDCPDARAAAANAADDARTAGSQVVVVHYTGTGAGCSGAEDNIAVDFLKTDIADNEHTHYFEGDDDLEEAFLEIADVVDCDDDNECTEDFCVNNLCESNPVSYGTRCADGTSNSPEGCPCEGGVTFLGMRYNGLVGSLVTVVVDGVTIFSSNLNNGDTFDLYGSRPDGRFKKNSVKFFLDGNLDTDVHVSCSQPIGVGHIFGSFTVMAFESRNAGPFSEVCGNSYCADDICDGNGECISDPDSSLCPDDGNACTDDFCDPILGCTTVNNSDSCDDGLFCTVGDACDGGSCTSSPRSCDDGVPCTVDSCDEDSNTCVHTPNNNVCDDGNVCTDDVCTTDLGCVFIADDSNVCSDGDFCNGLEVCDAGSCLAGSDPCEDGVACTVDSCDEVNDACSNSPDNFLCAGDGNACTDEVCVAGVGCTIVNDDSNICSDGAYCNGLELCVSGVCQTGSDPCVDGIACTIDSCDEINDVCSNSPDHSLCSSDGNACTDEVCVAGVGCTIVNDDSNICSDGAYCNGSELCVSGVCQAGSDPCDDGVACTVDVCDEVNSSCTNSEDDSLCGNGIFCDGVETCDAVNGCQTGTSIDCSTLTDQCNLGVCNEAAQNCSAKPKNDNQPCDDGLFCTVGEICLGGTCGSGSSLSCDDSVTCTNDSCDDNTNQCVNTPDDTICDNGLYCDGDELCDAIFDCQPSTGDPCDAIAGLKCAENLDTCVACTTNAQCDDGNECTQNSCVNNECVTSATTAGTTCTDDGIPCTINACDGSGGCAVTANDAVCPDDGNNCTDEVCDLNLGCLSIDNTNLCDDGSFCTVNDVCGSGICEGVARSCDDSIDCTIDSCDDVIDICVNATDDSQCPSDGNLCTDEVCTAGIGCQSIADDSNSCDDGDFCNGDEVCFGGACLPGTNPCNDNISCTTDTCDEVNDTCNFSPDDAQCPGDGNPCTDEVCTAGVGCQSITDNSNICDDGEFCNGGEVCFGGACLPGVNPCDDSVDCTIDSCDEVNDVCNYTPDDLQCLDDGNPCTDEVCDPTLGCLHLNNVALCDDGMFCTINDVCSNGVCTGVPLSCDDGIVCTLEHCDEAANACIYTPESTLCDDNNLCTDNACVVGTGCVYTPDDTNSCDDGEFCNGPESCIGGQCQAGSQDCGDSVGCTIDTCDETNDVCVHTPDDSVCISDGDFCNGIEVCDLVNDCVSPGNPCGSNQECCEDTDTCNNQCCASNECNDTRLCTTDTCEKGVCGFEQVLCSDDGSYCNGDEVCNEITGLCEPLGNPCSDPAGLCCEADDTCVSECCSDSDCNDSSLCTTDACVGGSCVYTPVVCAQDPLWCNGDEICNPISGCFSTGSPCEGTGLKCQESSNSCVTCLINSHCDDGDPCTFDICNSNNTCDHLPQCGACCSDEDGCKNDTAPDACLGKLGGEFQGVGSVCLGDANGDGVDDLCVPAVSTWGMVILLLLLLTGLTLRFDRSRTGVELR